MTLLAVCRDWVMYCVQAASHVVNVHCLRSHVDSGGILDNDDLVCDVAADKDQVLLGSTQRVST